MNKKGQATLKICEQKFKVAAIITDTHLSEKTSTTVGYIFTQLISRMKEEEVSKLYHAGDWFNSRKGQSLQVLKQTKEIIESLKASGIETFIIPGNHDKVDLDSEDSFLDIFDEYGFNVVKNHTIDYFGEVETGMLAVFMLPYFKETSQYPERLENLTGLGLSKNDKRPKVLITHVAVNGVKNNDGSEVVSELKEKAFKVFDHVYVGHYHNRSKVGHIEYIGSAYQANFGEDDQKGFSWLYSDGTIEFEKLKFPEFIKLNINVDSMNKEDSYKELLQIQKENPESNIRVSIIGDPSKLKAFSKNKLNEMGVQVTMIDQQIEDNKQTCEQVNVFDKSSVMSTFDKFSDEKQLEEKEKTYIKNKIDSCIV